MFGKRWIALLGFLVLAGSIASLAPVRAQDDKGDMEAINKKKTEELLEKAKEEYRLFFKRPETAIEYWAAIKFEMDLGKFDLAGLHLKLMLAKDPPENVDKDLIKLELAEGMSAFLRLKQVRPELWSDHPPFRKEAVESVDKLIDRVTKAVEKNLSDPERIKKFIARLDAFTEEERAYAYVQLARSRERAVPYLIEALRVNHGKPLFGRVRETMLRVGPETVPTYLEIFKPANDKDYRDVELRLALLDIIQKRDDARVIPYLWHMSASKKYPPVIRAKAKETLASVLRIPITDVPPSREALVYLAERYYQHKMPFKEDRPVQIYPWDGDALALKPVELTPYQAEEFFGKRYAEEALDLDPAYQPAQVVMLNLLLERYYRPELDQILVKPMPPKMLQLLTSLDTDLVIRVLERALDERQLPIALPIIQALGERGEYRAARPGTAGQPRGITKALYYPDRRIQFAALKAMLKMPKTTNPAVASDRLVELSRRFLASDLVVSKALVAYVPQGQDPAVRDLVKTLGYEAMIARKTNDAVELIKKSADYDLMILHRGAPELDFPFVLAQLRQHYDLASMPMVIVVAKGREKIVQKQVGKDPNVIIITEDKFEAGDDLKNLVETHIKKVQVVKLTEAERKEFAKFSMDTLWRMGRGEIEGYNVLPALDIIVKQLDSKDYALEAIEIIGRLPGKDMQYRLADIVGDPGRDLKMRMPAVLELNRHIRQNGLMIDRKQQADLKQAHQDAAEDSPLRAQLTVTLSTITRTSAAKTGADLTKFRSDPPPPKEKEEKKD